MVGIDDWAWRKGYGSYGTIIIDLERHEVLDVMQDRTADGTANWFRNHPEVEVVSRDRCGLYAKGAREGAPQAKQCADRFHILQNLRQAVENQLNHLWNQGQEITTEEGDNGPAQVVRGALRAAKFSLVKRLQAEGANATEIWRRTGVGMRAISQWMNLEALPERKRMAPRRNNPALFHEQLKAAWDAGRTHGRRLHAEIKDLGYTGSFSHLARYLSMWRNTGNVPPAADMMIPESVPVFPSGPAVPPIQGAALCMKPHGMLTARQAQTVEFYKRSSEAFAKMRALAASFRGILRGRDATKLDRWLNKAQETGFTHIRKFVKTVRRDIDAIRNAITEPWSNGPVEAHINKLKTLKRAMYGRCGTELLRARMIPL